MHFPQFNYHTSLLLFQSKRGLRHIHTLQTIHFLIHSIHSTHLTLSIIHRATHLLTIQQIQWIVVRYRSPMHLWQVCPALPSSAIPSVPQVRSYFRHISDTPPFVPVPLISPFVPMFPVSLISVSMPPWSSHLSPKFSSPVPVISCFTLVPLVPSPWSSQANPAA